MLIARKMAVLAGESTFPLAEYDVDIH